MDLLVGEMQGGPKLERAEVLRVHLQGPTAKGLHRPQPTVGEVDAIVALRPH